MLLNFIIPNTASMPQPARPIIQPNTYYHIYNRGVNRRTIFKGKGDYQRFLKLLGKYMEPVGSVLSYALMRDHFHLTVLINPASAVPPKLLRTPHALGRTFSHLQNAYANHFNHKYNTVSGLFETPYERKEVTSLVYLRNLIVYHHRNPEKHGVEQDFKQYFWTSYQELSSPLVETHVAKALTLSKFGGVEAFFAAHDAAIPLEMADFEFGGGQD
jgi:REP element-mobilizing transposase RayT